MENLSQSVILPEALQIIVDDVGWFIGTDDRYSGGPSRTGMPRRHRAEDYEALERLGEALDMKLLCGFVVGEWDSKHLLRTVPGATKYGADWDSAYWFKQGEAEKCRTAIRNSPHLEFALHGLMHYFWQDGLCLGPEFYYPGPDGELILMPYARQHLDAYFALLEQWDFGKEIRSFIPPCNKYVFSKGTEQLSYLLKDYGILYSSPYFTPQWRSDETKPTLCDSENGVITVDRTKDFLPWYQYGAVPNDGMVKNGIAGFHWVHFLSLSPQDNPLVVDKWIDYFKKQVGRFGTLLSRDVAHSASQAMYKRFVKMTARENRVDFDLSELTPRRTAGLEETFTISVKKGLRTSSCEGGTVVLYSAHETHSNYAVTPKAEFVSVTF